VLIATLGKKHPAADGKVVANQEIRESIVEIGIRKVARAANVNRETVALIANGGPVKSSTLARVVGSLSQ